MTLYERSEEAWIAARPENCFQALTDYEALPTWQRALKRCEVLAWDEQGLGREVRYEVDARLRSVWYQLRHSYDEPHAIYSEYIGGDFRHFEGDWRFDPVRDGALVAVTIRIDPGVRLPRPLARIVHDAVLRRSLEDLEHHLTRRD